MERSGSSPEAARLIRKAYKILYKNNLRLEDAIEEMEDLAGDCDEISNRCTCPANEAPLAIMTLLPITQS
jgi:UDP-N-acetylglucosamine acyltransferase